MCRDRNVGSEMDVVARGRRTSRRKCHAIIKTSIKCPGG